MLWNGRTGEAELLSAWMIVKFENNFLPSVCSYRSHQGFALKLNSGILEKYTTAVISRDRSCSMVWVADGPSLSSHTRNDCLALHCTWWLHCMATNQRGLEKRLWGPVAQMVHKKLVQKTPNILNLIIMMLNEKHVFLLGHLTTWSHRCSSYWSPLSHGCTDQWTLAIVSIMTDTCSKAALHMRNVSK